MDSSSSSSAAGGGYGADDGATADGVPQATFIERDPRIKDGPWSPLDAALVKAAQADAENATAPAPAPAAVRGGSGASSASAAAATGAEGAVLLGRSAAELKELAAALGHPAFRGQQIHDLLLKAARDPASRGAKSVADMHTLPAALRAQLAALGATTGRSAVHHTVASPCGTRKWLLQLAEGRLIETVGIPSDGGGSGGGAPRLTVCVSSQVGCPMRCSFCATGRGGFARNLRPHEILDQVLTVQEEFGRRVTNVGELFWWRAWEGVIAALFGGGGLPIASAAARVGRRLLWSQPADAAAYTHNIQPCPSAIGNDIHALCAPLQSTVSPSRRRRLLRGSIGVRVNCADRRQCKQDHSKSHTHQTPTQTSTQTPTR